MSSKPEMIFLSYAKEDIDKARELCEKMEAAGLNVWFDKKSLKPGELWKATIRNAIRKSRYFVSLLSSESSSKFP
jgi:hypothetical protein